MTANIIVEQRSQTFYETHIAHRLALIHYCTCSSRLEFQPTIWALNYPRKHNCITSNQGRHFHRPCRVLNFHSQNL